jgi:hypothetical protein
MTSFTRLITVISLAFSLTSIACGPPKITTVDAPPSSSSSTAPAREVSGEYKVTGADENGNPAYTGALNVTSEGDGYRFRWTTNRGSQDGIGVQMGDAIAVSYARTGGGKGCGVVLYRIASDGGLTGRVARWGESLFGTETGTRTEGTSFAGTYDIKGTTADRKEYSGTLNIARNGAGYQFDWKMAEPRVAFGTWRGSVAAASFGGRQCSFILYTVQGDGDLKGHWGGQRMVTFGTESAER